ncbi:transketolase [Paraburkholderia steynii]|uniref:Transketolase n=1 Tax=Paraburkholderia steynii TaxID=1245441 RepID=A0A4R0XGN6_9BURK|nr:transketolase [Paraburkholderia steynii]
MPQFTPTSLRKAVLKMAFAGATVHIGCAFSIIEICAVLYRNHLRYPGSDPRAENRDYFVLSKGHGVMAQYACLNELGWVTDTELAHYFGDGTRLKGLSDAHVRGCEVTSGSLGHGLSVGVGLALAARLRNTDQRCYVVAGDGEMNEGAMWEALLFASHQKLDNLMLVVDENGFQAMGRTKEVLGLDNLAGKLESFGFETRTVDGHDEHALDQAIRMLNENRNGQPKAIVARTVKGKGVSFMEDENAWHYTRLNADTFATAMAELDEQ